MSASVSTHAPTAVRYVKIPLRTKHLGHIYPQQYAVERLNAKQPRLRQRVIFKPLIRLDSYRVEAVIDYLHIWVELEKPSQGHAVQRIMAPHACRPIWVEPQGSNTASATHFLVKFNEPKRYEVERALNALEAARPFAAWPIVNAMEVSVDWYPRLLPQSVAPLVQIAGVLQKHLIPPRFDFSRRRASPRVVYTEYDPFENPRSVPRHLIQSKGDRFTYVPTYLDGTNYFEEKGAPAMWRIMIKTTDNRRSLTEYDELPSEKWRARVEVLLDKTSVNALGIQKLGDLGKFKFENLRSDYFSHWYTTIPLPSPCGGFPGSMEDAKGILNAFVCAGGLAAHREELAVLERLRKQVSKGRISIERARLLRQAEETMRREHAYRLGYKDLNGKIETALRGLTWK